MGRAGDQGRPSLCLALLLSAEELHHSTTCPPAQGAAARNSDSGTSWREHVAALLQCPAGLWDVSALVAGHLPAVQLM